MGKTRHLRCIIAVAVFLALLGTALGRATSSEKGVDFQVVPDKTVHSPGSTMTVRFIITNTGEVPLYIHRGISECSDPEGSFFFQILDQSNHDLRREGCSVDLVLGWENHVLEQMSDPHLWIALQPGEVFGKSSTFTLPDKRGTYRLKAELTSPGFTEKLRNILAQQHIRVLHAPCPAPVVTVTVR